jgi:hypothetical protein
MPILEKKCLIEKDVEKIRLFIKINFTVQKVEKVIILIDLYVKLNYS